MEGLTFSASHQGNSTEFRSKTPLTPENQAAAPSGEAAEQDQSAPKTAGANKIVRVEAQGSPFQARLNYDRNKASVFVEILDRSTGDVIQRLPAESAADRIRELTGGYGGTVVDKIA